MKCMIQKKNFVLLRGVNEKQHNKMEKVFDIIIGELHLQQKGQLQLKARRNEKKRFGVISMGIRDCCKY